MTATRTNRTLPVAPLPAEPGEAQIWQRAVAKLPWAHNVILIQMVKDHPMGSSPFSQQGDLGEACQLFGDQLPSCWMNSTRRSRLDMDPTYSYRL